ncbi:hypothetical protein PHLCEN_2v1893, partial [Hermanssonia centrifuga]
GWRRAREECKRQLMGKSISLGLSEETRHMYEESLGQGMQVDDQLDDDATMQFDDNAGPAGGDVPRAGESSDNLEGEEKADEFVSAVHDALAST